MSSTGVCSSISLKGSVKIICEFFSKYWLYSMKTCVDIVNCLADYAINNILFQRGIYPSESVFLIQTVSQ